MEVAGVPTLVASGVPEVPESECLQGTAQVFGPALVESQIRNQTRPRSPEVRDAPTTIFSLVQVRGAWVPLG